ncbi:MAG TPA: response regulator [Gemmatimonadales bacterium]|nr:response regulator [Gemmatimonadales bacterium]
MSAVDRVVLVVDDEAPLRRVLERCLRRSGYRVLSTGSGEDAYSLLDAEHVDAALLDIRLPTMSGLELYVALAHRWPGLEGRMAIMTGDAEAQEVRAWLAEHQCTVLRKPFNLTEIEAWLGGLWEIREQETSNG